MIMHYQRQHPMPIFWKVTVIQRIQIQIDIITMAIEPMWILHHRQQVGLSFLVTHHTRKNVEEKNVKQRNKFLY